MIEKRTGFIRRGGAYVVPPLFEKEVTCNEEE